MPDEAWKADIEARMRAVETSQVANAVRYEAIASRLDKIDGHISKLLWLIIAAIVGGFMTFVINGGLVGV